MQKTEFNNLMDGAEAKYANFDTMLQSDDLMGKLLAAQSKGQSKGHSKEQVNEAREEIAKHEAPIDPNVRYKMDLFISQQRAIGTKERTIRRMVQRMWNIAVI